MLHQKLNGPEDIVDVHPAEALPSTPRRASELRAAETEPGERHQGCESGPIAENDRHPQGDLAHSVAVVREEFPLPGCRNVH